jgi:prepilin-type N-terminal cleavage/methylation domain-containing protein/prepilin-type processing-associated H-X9-DG protein
LFFVDFNDLIGTVLTMNLGLPPKRKIHSRHESSEIKAFTLVELLAVIAIIGVLAGIIIPVVGAVRQSARANKLTANIRATASAALLSAEENKGRLPWHHFINAKGETVHWQLVVRPYLGYVDIGRNIDIRDLAYGGDDILHDPLDTSENSYLKAAVPNIAINGKGRIGSTSVVDGLVAGATGRLRSTIANPTRLMLLGPGASGTLSGQGSPSNWPWDNITTTLSARDVGSSDPFRYKDAAPFAFCDGHVEHKTREWVLSQAAMGTNGTNSPFFDPDAKNP